MKWKQTILEQIVELEYGMAAIREQTQKTTHLLPSHFLTDLETAEASIQKIKKGVLETDILTATILEQGRRFLHTRIFPTMIQHPGII